MIDNECEKARLHALHHLNILDTKPEVIFDNLTQMAASIFDTPYVHISLVDKDYLWFKSAMGERFNCVARKNAFCDYAIQKNEVMIVNDALQDVRFQQNPYVTGDPHIRFYAGAPLRYYDQLIGTICIIDTKPRDNFSPKDAQLLSQIADSVVAALEMRKEAQFKKTIIDNLIESNKKLEMMEEMSGVGYWKLNFKDESLQGSRGVYIQLGLEADTAVPDLKTLYSHYSPEVTQDIKLKMTAAIANNQSYLNEYPMTRPDGSEIWLRVLGHIERDESGRPKSIFGISQDITLEKHNSDSLKAAKESAESFSKAQSDFLSNMSHEIRTPLTTLIGYANLLADLPSLPEPAKSYVNRIKTSGSALHSLVNDVLDFSKLEAGQVVLDPKPTDMVELAKEILEQFSYLAETNKVALSLKTCGKFKSDLLIDQARLRQVLYNLIGNACKFTQNGMVELSLQILGNHHNPTLKVDVVDTGKGIDLTKNVDLFQRFVQADSSISRTYGGTGLGLSICHEIIQLMGGKINVESSLGKGSHFWFEVPTTMCETTRKPEKSIKKIIKTTSAKRVFDHNLKVLIVDDHPVNRELIKLLLKDYDLEISDAINGEQAVELSQVCRFDLIFMDIQMPVLDGITATKMIRHGDNVNAQTPIIALSAMTNSKLEEKTMDAGFSHYLSKPIDTTQFFDTVIDCLKAIDVPKKRKA